MRWIFIFLVFLNFFFYIWQHQQNEQSNVSTSSENNLIDEHIPTIYLLSERINNNQQRADTQPLPPDNSINQPITTSPLPLINQQKSQLKTNQTTCLYFGGVANKSQLKLFIPYLTAINDTITPIEIKLNQYPKFRLYLTTDNEKQQNTLLTQLKAISINALLSNKDHDNNIINLGIFYSQDDFLYIQQPLNEIKLTPEVELLKVAATSYWLKIPENEQTFFTPELLKELAKTWPSMQQELMFCNLSDH